MRKVKKFAALLLCGALTLSALTGCGGDDGGSSKESSSEVLGPVSSILGAVSLHEDTLA